MNLNKLGGLDKLTDNQRYWLGYLNREAERREWSTPDEEPFGRTVFLTPSQSMSRMYRIEMFLFDSLMVGLYSQEPLMILRAYAQTCEYFGMLQEMKGGLGMASLSDARACLRSKTEDLVREL